MTEGPLSIPMELFSSLRYFLPRLLFTQTRWGDVARALEHFPLSQTDTNTDAFWESWKDGWCSLAEEYLRAGARSTHALGRNKMKLLACECFHWAEFMYFSNPEEKALIRTRMLDAFNSAMEATPNNFRRGSAKWSGSEIPYYHISPDAESGHAGTVLLCNGLDSVKEVELMAFSRHFLRRGMAVVLFDGPGQGLNLGTVPMTHRFEDAVQALLDHLATENLLHRDRLGFFGVSYGGYLGLRVAKAIGSQFRGIVNLSGGPKMAPFTSLPRRIREDFKFAFMETDEVAMSKLMADATLEADSSWGSKILSIHGAFDHIFPADDVLALDPLLGDGHETIFYPREAHVCLNHFEEIMNRFGDWMANTMAGSTMPEPLGLRG